NREYDKVGSSCISERRAIDLIEFGEIRTPFMQFGDQIEMETTLADGSPLFGVLRQQVVKHKA
ncbi:MAG: fumarylacetoacetate hydrolase, partial [Halieaceae bacterium]